ncbi:MAG: DUF4358 domain-containing protein [Proteocatella sp.]
MKTDIRNTNLKYMIYALALIGLMAMLTGCYASSQGKLEITSNDIAENIKNEFPLDYMSPNGNSKALKRFYSLNFAAYTDVILYTPLSSMDVKEMMIIKVEDESQIDAIETAVENRVSKQIESFSGYGAEQCALLEDYVFKIKGDYVFYSVGENAESMKEIFTDSLK